MAAETIKVSIGFQPLLLTITQCLGLPAPEYEIVEIVGKKGSVTVRTINNTIEGVYLGRQARTLENSMEKAAQCAIHVLIKKYGVYVKHVTAARQENCERLTNLWRLKQQELERLQKGLPKLSMEQEFELKEMHELNYVQIDFVQTLQEVTRKLPLNCSGTEVVEHTPRSFTAWLTITHHNSNKGLEATFSNTATTFTRAVQELAEQVIEYLVPIYNIEVIDANYICTR